jgi:hypothetical protein
MYDEETLDAAVAAGVMEPGAAARLRAFAAQRASGTSDPDNERFRLLTGFNDVFVTVACVLLLVAAWLLLPRPGAAGAAVAVLAWVLAEYFTRVRRMALPSIALLLAFVGGVGAAVLGLLAGSGDVAEEQAAWIAAVSAASAAVGAWAHWRRFRVPITAAAGAAALVGVAAALVAQATGAAREPMLWLMLTGGLAVFALAMRVDAADTARITRRTDVAFWLHLLAAPLIVHPVFALSGLLGNEPGTGAALAVIAVYAGLIVVALVIDRRALLVSALGYVLYAINALIGAGDRVGEAFGLTALAIGAGLVMLSAAWGPLRRVLVAFMPSGVRSAVPA